VRILLALLSLDKSHPFFAIQYFSWRFPAMKQTFLSKTLGTLGLVAVLATVATTSVQQTAQAQMNVNVPADIDDEACMASGKDSFYLLQNVNLSPEQILEIFELTELKFEIYDRLVASYPSVPDLSGGSAFVSRPGAEPMPPDVSAAFDAATVKFRPTADSLEADIAAINEQFGQYGEFGVYQKVVFTPEIEAEMKALEEDFVARYIAVMTPEQQQQYQDNLATESRINEICGIVKYDRSNDESGVNDIYIPFEPTF
jgi:hypothetical protein